jgi:predicted Rossmann fold flavoprotein
MCSKFCLCYDDIMKKLIIIGGGPAGCMAAISAKTTYPDIEVTLIERNARLGEKLRLSGGGRCNISANVSNQEVINQTPRNGRFLYASLESMNPTIIKQFFKVRGCPLVEEDHQRLFPKSHKAGDVVNVLLTEMNKLGVNLMFNTKVENINFSKKTLITSQETLKFDHLILAVGGLSYPQTGSDGELLLKCQSNIEISECYPAETPLVSHEAFIQSKCLQGLSLRDVSLTLYIDEKKKKQVVHDLLFTHFGLSGPAALQCSSACRDCFEKKQKVVCILDMLPNQSFNEIETLLKEKTMKEVCSQNQLPVRLLKAYEMLSEFMSPTTFFKAWPITIHDMRGFNQAFVTSGGVSVKEIDPKTMRLKSFDHISVCGEAIDVHSHTGGFNITIAMSTGYHAGMNIKI